MLNIKTVKPTKSIEYPKAILKHKLVTINVVSWVHLSGFVVFELSVTKVLTLVLAVGSACRLSRLCRLFPEIIRHFKAIQAKGSVYLLVCKYSP